MFEGVNALFFFLILFPLVAMLYTSVGHGGASGYLGLMVLFNYPAQQMKATALLLNLFAAAISFIQYFRQGHFNLKVFLPFACSSIPAAFVGGYLSVEVELYKQILAVFLLLAAVKLSGIFGKNAEAIKQIKIVPALLIGAFIGFFSGLIGIGGGVILSPILLLLAWANMKTTAAVSALFIWLNSAAGFTGMLISGQYIAIESAVLVGLVIIGALIGAYLGAVRLNAKYLRYVLGSVLLLASIKLIMT